MRPDLFFCCYRFFRLPLPRLLLGDFSISDLRRMPMFDMENVQAAWEERDKEMLKVLLHGYVWNHIEGGGKNILKLLIRYRKDSYCHPWFCNQYFGIL